VRAQTHSNYSSHTLSLDLITHTRHKYDAWREKCATRNSSDLRAQLFTNPLRHSANSATHCNTLQYTRLIHVVCCSVLQYVAVSLLCCSVLQCAAVCCSESSVLQCAAVCCSVLQYAAVCFRVLQSVADCCSVLQCAAVCCSALHCVTAEKS